MKIHTSTMAMTMAWPLESLQAYLDLLRVNYLRAQERELLGVQLGVGLQKSEEEYSRMATELLEYLFKANDSVIVLRDGVKYLYTFQEFFVMIPSAEEQGLCWWPTHFESLDSFLNWAVPFIYADENT